ncbi:hypothetical protein J0S82_011235, partial [Galemys pyrenaicus]
SKLKSLHNKVYLKSWRVQEWNNSSDEGFVHEIWIMLCLSLFHLAQSSLKDKQALRELVLKTLMLYSDSDSSVKYKKKNANEIFYDLAPQINRKTPVPGKAHRSWESPSSQLLEYAKAV